MAFEDNKLAGAKIKPESNLPQNVDAYMATDTLMQLCKGCSYCIKGYFLLCHLHQQPAAWHKKKMLILILSRSAVSKCLHFQDTSTIKLGSIIWCCRQLLQQLSWRV